MSDIKLSFSNWKEWGPFHIPAIGIMVITLVILGSAVINIERAVFLQKVIIWVLGAGIIAYGHSLAHSTQKLWQGTKFKDLSPLGQGIALAAHFLWFCFFVFIAIGPHLGWIRLR